MARFDPALLSRLIGAGRMLVGAVAIAAPRPAARLVGLPDEDLGPAAVLFARIAGDRDVALGAALAFAPPSQLRNLLVFNAATDAADVLSSLLALRAGLPRRAAFVSSASAVAYTALEVYLLRRLRSAPSAGS